MTRAKRATFSIFLMMGILGTTTWHFRHEIEFGLVRAIDRWADDLRPAILDVDLGFEFPSGTPPDPGEAGKRSIEGIDADADGVRDDIQRWIDAFQPTRDSSKRLALRQNARLYQDWMTLNFDDPAVRKAHWLRVLATISCTHGAFGLRAGFADAHFRFKMINTADRMLRYRRNLGKYPYSEFTSHWPGGGETCENR